jgi:hypothetical protein
MPDDQKPKMLTFEPPLEIFVAKAGEVVSCRGDGEFEHQGELTVATFPSLGSLLEFLTDVDEGRAQCVLKLDGQVIFIPSWLGFYLEGLDKAGRVKLVDVPEAGESGTVTKA